MSDLIRVVFDLDDTLYPEWTFAHGGFAAAGTWVLDNWGVDGVAARHGSCWWLGGPPQTWPADV